MNWLAGAPERKDGGEVIRIRACRAGDFSGNQIKIYMYDREGQSDVVNLEAKPHEEGADRPPVMRLEENYAQMLMDDLWNCGMRPTEGTGSAGSLAATQEHLKDMRSIVFKQLGVDFDRGQR